MIKQFLYILILLFFTSCSSKQLKFENIFQTKDASTINENYLSSIDLLLDFKKKLDKRNPKSFSKISSNTMVNLIKELSKDMHLKYKGKNIIIDKEYLNIAFDKNYIKNRNDYLIMGIYFMLMHSYDIHNGYKVNAYSYDVSKLKKLYHNLQILKWKIKTKKDLNNRYLFLTWQNNWQIDLERLLIKQDLKNIDLVNLEHIKNKKESFLLASNFSFEVILSLIINNTKNSLTLLDISTSEIGIDALKTIFIFI
ncbi:MAG: hypothetical protein MJK08_07285 [Campylobacterales bacterium]|nr:hypothetical protein [Campylobacterales bacterium]